MVSKLLFLAKEFTIDKKHIFNDNIRIKIKTTAITVIKCESKQYPMSEGNTCIPEPNLEILPLT